MQMNLNIGHELGVGQQLNLAPQLLQWLRILQMPTHELSLVVQKELQQNPAIEVDEAQGSEADADEPGDDDAVEKTCLAPEIETTFDDNQLSAKYELLADLDDEWRRDTGTVANAASVEAEEEKYQHVYDSIPSDQTLHPLLLNQLRVSCIPQAEVPAAELIIGSLDERGYLVESLADLSSHSGITVAALEAGLRHVQAMTPAGVGSRDLRECLLLQMEDDANPVVALARRVVSDFLEALGRRQYSEIAAALNVTVDDIESALDHIRGLDPTPGRTAVPERTEYIAADVIVSKHDGDYVIELNDRQIPRLRISSSCRRLLDTDTLRSDEATYIRGRIRAANFMIQGIHQRHETLRRVAEQIVRSQREYLDDPSVGLKPLTMAKIAAIIGVHETTVSRTIANKYMKTPHGLLPMRGFFGVGYDCADGSALTPGSVKRLIVTIISEERTDQPMRDVDIAASLRRRGLKVARRTVAKYRRDAGLPSARERTSSDRLTLHRRPEEQELALVKDAI
jgi:RNA polymerase sigma-54 factor